MRSHQQLYIYASFEGKREPDDDLEDPELEKIYQKYLGHIKTNEKENKLHKEDKVNKCLNSDSE